jgi:hypothetical protein
MYHKKGRGAMKSHYVASPRKTGIQALALLCFVFAALVATGAAAQSTEAQADTQRSEKAKPHKLDTRAGIRISYLSFANESMKETYEDCLFFTFEGVAWVKPQLGLSIEVGYMTAEGTPLRPPSTWELLNSWAKLTAMPIGVNALYRFTKGSPAEPITPYVGIGPTLWIGGERLYANASRMYHGINEAFEANLLAVNIFGGGQALCGSTFRLGGNIRGVLEIRYSLTSSGGLADVVDAEDEGLIEPALYSVVKRSDFEFSGWRVDVGVQW